MAKSQRRRPSPSVDLSAPLAEQPWWIKTLVWVGVPTIAFGYLLYFVLGDMSGGMKDMRAALAQQQKDMAGLIQHLQNDTDQGWVMQSTLARICINTARNDADRIACVSVTRRPQ